MSAFDPKRTLKGSRHPTNGCADPVRSLVLSLGAAMRRRDFIKLLGGAAATWPLATRAQQPDRMRLIGVLMHLAADDVEGQARFTAFLQGLQQLGWTDGRNVRIELRWGAN